MPAYIQLLRLSTEGRGRALQDPDFLFRTQAAIEVPGIEVLGIYGVLGEYDFVNIVEGPDNYTVARYSMEMAVKVGAHITTLPAIPIARLHPTDDGNPSEVEVGRALDPDAIPDRENL
ncbi:MAG: GYD domain-containing protein [SAR202 cluster bacterium]|nr:GYD domain-containing protein [SAR202 cluster bacterium]